MKYLYLFLLIICTSCELIQTEPDHEDFDIDKKRSLINYYITVVPTDKFDSLSFSFLYTRAFQNYTTIRTVYLDKKDISVNLNQKQTISLGSSTIEPLFIEGYDFGLALFRLRKDNKVYDEFVWGFDEAFAKAEFTPVMGDTIDIYFEFDIDASFVLDSAGKNWITPKIKLERK